jgi:hypothetical protein
MPTDWSNYRQPSSIPPIALSHDDCEMSQRRQFRKESDGNHVREERQVDRELIPSLVGRFPMTVDSTWQNVNGWDDSKER